MTSISAAFLQCFNESYDASRQMFILTCKQQGVLVTSLLNPVCQGLNNEPLFIDIATIGDPNSRRVLIVSSGTHGIEGYVGSALQIASLNDDFYRALPDDCVCYLVHAVNPFGFSYYRRANEHNIDLNRNFVDFSRPLPDSSEFCELQDFIQKHTQAGKTADEFDSKVLFRNKFGEVRYQRAMTSGQYTEASGIYFGGFEPAWSNLRWRAFLDDAITNATVVIHIDIHTGLGEFGKESLIYTRSTTLPAFNKACECFGRNELVLPGDTLTPDVNGTIPSSFSVHEDSKTVIGVALEFGTLPLQEMLSTLVLENTTWHAGITQGKGRENSVGKMLDCFCPRDDNWRLGVWQQYQTRLKQALTYLNEY